MFALCCRTCPKLRNAKALQILLKSEYLVRRYAIMSSYPLDKKGITVGDETYFETYRRSSNQLETCYDSKYRKVIVFIYKFI
ncbi:unnamed protein product [Gongylonema pulchrum]|uniref:Uncharacterized protein n=1 Tax=Gongylonema pulchrum TaxID=637853 RepID=A0A183DLL3_9BILA|nr:unnamed protein product [Gongylonema pulchrum]